MWEEIDQLRKLREREMHRLWEERGIARAHVQQALETIWGNHIEGFHQYEPGVKARLELATKALWQALNELDRSQRLKEVEEKLEQKGWKP